MIRIGKVTLRIEPAGMELCYLAGTENGRIVLSSWERIGRHTYRRVA